MFPGFPRIFSGNLHLFRQMFGCVGCLVLRGSCWRNCAAPWSSLIVISSETMFWVKKKRFPIENSGKIRIGGLGGSVGPFLLQILRQTWPRNSVKNMRFYFEFVIFGFHFWKPFKPAGFSIFEPSGCDHDPQNQLFVTSEAPIYYKKSRNNLNQFSKNNVY